MIQYRERVKALVKARAHQAFKRKLKGQRNQNGRLDEIEKERKSEENYQKSIRNCNSKFKKYLSNFEYSQIN